MCVSAVLWKLTGLVFPPQRLEEISVQGQDIVLHSWSSSPAWGSFPWAMLPSLGMAAVAGKSCTCMFAVCGLSLWLTVLQSLSPALGKAVFCKAAPLQAFLCQGNFVEPDLIQPSPLSWWSAGLMLCVSL